MARYIDADALKRKLIDEKSFYPAIVASALEETPTADVEEVVRCKECKYWRTEHGGFCEASNALSEINNANNDFCSYGKRSDK